MKHSLTTLILGTLLGLYMPAQALTLHDMDFPEQLEATADSPELFLRGAAVRRVYGMVDTYVGLLYTADNNLSHDELISADKARRMVFHVTSSRVSARRFTNAIEEGLALNISEEDMQAIAPRVQELTQLFNHRFVEGTVGSIEWVPAAQHSRIVIDGEVRGTVPGKDLNDALLRIWIGERPVSERFKREVLGVTAAAD